MGDRAPVAWPAALLALLTAHLVGDFLVQTEWQATTKNGGLTYPTSRKALLAHVSAYTASFTPAFVWIARRKGPVRAVEVAVAVALPHLAIDDGRIVETWLREVKRAPQPSPGLRVAVDQSFHVVCLLGAALLAGR